MDLFCITPPRAIDLEKWPGKCYDLSTVNKKIITGLLIITIKKWSHNDENSSSFY